MALMRKTFLVLLVWLLIALGASPAAEENVTNSIPAARGAQGPFSLAARVDLRSELITAMASGDFNQDDYADLALVNPDSGVVTILYNDGAGSFGNPQRLEFGAGIQHLWVEDLDGDERLDVLVIDTQSNSLLARLGNEDGTFGPILQTPIGARPVAMVVADFNNDSIPDVVTAIPTVLSGAIRVQLGLGDGTFAPPEEFDTEMVPSEMVACDFNRDDQMDLVIKSPPDQSGSLALLAGDGKGGFERSIRIPISDRLYSITAGDLDGDGRVDLLVGALTLGNEGRILVFLGDESEPTFFRRLTPFPTLPIPVALALEDFDGDTYLDLLVALDSAQSVTIYYGMGRGLFEDPQQGRSGMLFPVGGSPRPLVVDQFTPNESVDVAVASRIPSSNQSTISILLGNSAGSLFLPPSPDVEGGTRPPNEHSRPRALVSADFNQDKILDLAVANSERDTVSILLGDGSGNFIFDKSLAVRPTGDDRSYLPTALAMGDFHGNGLVDLVALNRDTDSISLFAAIEGGDFAPPRITSFPWAEGARRASALAVADFNGDNNLDLAIVSERSNELIILLGQGDGSFNLAQPIYSNPSLQAASAILTADFNGDNLPDLAILADPDETGRLLILYGNGDGTFTDPLPAIDIGQFGSIAFVTADFNGDNRLDFAVINSRSRSLSVLLATDDDYVLLDPIPLFSRPAAIALADLNQDDTPELIIVSRTANNLSIFVSRGDGTFVDQGVDWGAGVDPRWVITGDFNQDDRLDLAIANFGSDTVSILLNQTPSKPAARDH